MEGGPSVVTVIFHDGKKVSGDVVGFAKNGLDLAAVKIPKQPNLCKLTLANPEHWIKVGYNVFAIGTPLDVDNARTFTDGKISKTVAKKGMIQHTAVIKHGNSGGPLLNSNGELIGVNTEIELDKVPTAFGEGITNAVGIAFAIPVTQVKSFLTAINKDDISPVSTLPKDEFFLQPLTLNGENISDNLTKEQPQKFYIFEGKAGQKITVEMDSNNFDPKLVLYQVIPLENNEYEYQPLKESTDKAPGNVNTILEITLLEDGNYVIVATSKINGGIGGYSLRGFSN